MKRRFSSIPFPLRAKLMVLFLLLITIPFLISGVVNYIKVSNTIERTIHAYVPQIMNLSIASFDHYITEMDQLLIVPNFDNDVMSILKQHRDARVSPVPFNSTEDLKMNLFISSLTFNRPNIKGYMIISNDGALFSNLEHSISNHWKPSGELWVQQVMDAQGDLVIIPPHEPSYYIHDQETVFSLARLIREPYTNEPLGIVKIDMTRALIEDVFASVSLSRNGKLYISDSLGNLYYPNELDDSFVPQPGEDIILIEGEPFVRILGKSPQYDLHIIGLIPAIEFQRDAKETARFYVIISILSLIMAYVLASFASKQLVKPIRHLQSTMKKVQKGWFQVRASVQTHDEIGDLTNGFNSMLEEIDRLIKEVYETRFREREAELSALQDQMNPHFLYNTLEQINMMAIQHHRFEISDVVSNLGKLLRYTVDNQERVVCLREEIRFVQSYLYIQKLRYGERLRSSMNIDSSLNDLLVPKLILQPLIENAIQHGIGEGEGVIEIHALTMDHELVITVKDNGKGLTWKEIEDIEASMYGKTAYGEHAAETFGETKRGYALRNIHQRLRLLYGEPSGVLIDKGVAEGSVFALRFPARSKSS